MANRYGSGSISKTNTVNIVRKNQQTYIVENGFITAAPCGRCEKAGFDCVMDRSQRYSKCAMCTRQGRLCRREAHTDKEWNMLRNAEKKVAQGLSDADSELELLNPELEQLQRRLAEVQQKISVTLARHARLRKQERFLKERGFKMSEHDAELLRILDEKREASPEETRQLSATAEDPLLPPVLEEMGRLSPSFWFNFDQSVNEILGPGAGNLSGS